MQRIYWKLAALLTVALVGCSSTRSDSSSTLPLVGRTANQASVAAATGPSDRMSKAKAVLAAAKVGRSAEQASDGNLPNGLPDKHPLLTNDKKSPVLAKFRQAAHAVGKAMQPKSTVKKASDPTQLQYDPGPLAPELYISAAVVLQQQGRHSEAVTKYQEALRLDPENRRAIVGLGRLYHQLGNYQEAIAIYQQGVRRLGNDPVLLNDLGLCFARLGKPQPAIEAIQAAIEARPESDLYRNNLAAVLIESDRVDEAVQMLTASHGPAVAHYNVGYFLYQRGLAEAARQQFELALRSDPMLAQARQMLEQIPQRIGRRPSSDHSGASTSGVSYPNTARGNVDRPGGNDFGDVLLPQPDGATDGAGDVRPVAHLEPIAATRPKPVAIPQLLRLPLSGDELPKPAGFVPPLPEEPAAIP